MRLGAFELNEPLPQLSAPHAVVMLDPWINAGNVGSLTLSWLETHFKATEVGKLSRPGNFFDFTRYRPTTLYEGEKRRLEIPNVHVTYAQTGTAHDFLFIRLLEPHNHAEFFMESFTRLLQKFEVAQYCQVGSMYDLVPHTRPLLVTGRASDKDATAKLERLGMSSGSRGGGYSGPTSITSLVSIQAAEMGMETMSLMVHLPQYTQFEDDYTGAVRLMEALAAFYNLPQDESYAKRASEQMEQINTAVEKDSQIRATVEQLESTYDSRAKRRAARSASHLSPEVERFLNEMGKRLGDS